MELRDQRKRKEVGKHDLTVRYHCVRLYKGIMKCQSSLHKGLQKGGNRYKGLKEEFLKIRWHYFGEHIIRTLIIRLLPLSLFLFSEPPVQTTLEPNEEPPK